MHPSGTPDNDAAQAHNDSAAITICVADSGNVVLWQGDDAIVVAPDDIERLARALLRLAHPPTDRTGAERQRRHRARKAREANGVAPSDAGALNKP